MKRCHAARVLFFLIALAGWSFAQETSRTKIAQGEYAVSTDEDLGTGPIETEVFHFGESWTLWHNPEGSYEVEGERMFESPRGRPHEDRFWEKLDKHLAPTEVK